MTYTAMNAAAAAAYAAVSRAPPQPDALEQLLRQQREAINQHLAVIERDRARSGGVPTDSTSVVSGSDSNVLEGSAPGCVVASAPEGSSCVSEASIAGTGLSQLSQRPRPESKSAGPEPAPSADEDSACSSKPLPAGDGEL